jgi:hypothetical protein
MEGQRGNVSDDGGDDGAIGAAAAPAGITLRVTQQRNSIGQSIVSVWMPTTANGTQTKATVFTQPGYTACQANPLQPWPGGDVQLLYGYATSPRPARWQPVVRFVATRAQHLTVCGYVVDQGALRFGGSYVQATTHTIAAVAAPRRTAPAFGAGPWRSCAANRS